MTLLFCKALLGFFLFDVLGLSHDFPRLLRIVSTWKTQAVVPTPNTIEGVCHVVNYACIWYPKPILCLQRSAVTTCLLRSSGVSAQMVMGAQPMPFKAHAWTEADGRVINERRDVRQIYGVLERC
jgi:hypothetical protein